VPDFDSRFGGIEASTGRFAQIRPIRLFTDADLYMTDNVYVHAWHAILCHNSDHVRFVMKS